MTLFTCHLLRPYALLSFIPLMALLYRMQRMHASSNAWRKSCDAHLLPYLLDRSFQRSYRATGFVLLLFSSLILSLSGPSVHQLPVPTFETLPARILLFDLSSDMLVNDPAPNRLKRAQFKLHDLFNMHAAGQYGLIAYTSEPFVISPLTRDTQTLEALLPSLTPDVMPVNGNRLEQALTEALQLMQQGGLSTASLLVLTAEPPSPKAIREAKSLSHQGITTSVLPITNADVPNAFIEFAHAGGGHVVSLSNDLDLKRWIHRTSQHKNKAHKRNQNLLAWRDDGRWLLIPALILCLCLFRRNGLEVLRS